MNSYGNPDQLQNGSNSNGNQPSIQKNFYQLHDDVKNRPQVDVDLYMKEAEITCEGNEIPRPVQTFKESSLPKYLVDQLESVFQKPSVIQSQAWPVVLQGRDFVGVARTGSGKTLSFIVPAIVHVMAQNVLQKGDGPIVLVMAPTRELAVQIEQEAKKFASCCQLSTLAVYGGAPKYDQQTQLYKGVEILIATPGRLLDFLNRGDTNLRRVTYLVLDEADRMLDMGFEKDIRTIIEKIPNQERQTMMFSATWPKEVQGIATDYCYSDPCTVRIGKDESMAGGLTVNKDIRQEIEVLDGNHEKYDALIQVLTKCCQDRPQKIIIFCQTKRGVDELEKNLRSDQTLQQNRIKVQARGIHGDKVQYQRDSIFGSFKKPLTEETSILIATDVASRGLDVRDIGIAMNFDMPTNIEDYVHRIGRTGRAGDKGRSISFLNSSETSIADDLIQVMTSSGQSVPDRLYDMKQQAMDYQREKRQRYRQHDGSRRGKGSYAHPQKFQRTSYFDRPERNSSVYTQASNRDDDWNSHSNGGASKKRDVKYQDKEQDRFTQQDLKNDLWGKSNGGGW